MFSGTDFLNFYKIHNGDGKDRGERNGGKEGGEGEKSEGIWRN
jgi:hypothetical protein